MASKRKAAGHDSQHTTSPPISPPPTKRRLESTTTKKAVTDFFKPSSQKEPDRIQWRIIENSLMIGKYSTDGKAEPPMKRRRIAAFDFDSTLIGTSSGNVFGKDVADWKWWDASVPKRLRSLYDDGYAIAIVSNQGGISLQPNAKGPKADAKRLTTFKTKVGHVLAHLDLPVSIYAATSNDRFRKPRVGMWLELLGDYDLDEGEGPDLAASFFVGDAGGRLAAKGVKADHSSSDRDFAANVGIKFQTPEEFFLGQEARPFARKFEPQDYVSAHFENGEPGMAENTFQKTSPVDVVLFCGSPGSGKSTFYWRQLLPLGYERVNQDTLKTRERCLKAADDFLSSGTPVAVDNTNADIATRAHWVALARRHAVPIRCVRFAAPAALCAHNDAVRALHPALFNPERRAALPPVAIASFPGRYQAPRVEEGFADVATVEFRFRGSAEQRRVWTLYWT